MKKTIFLPVLAMGLLLASPANIYAEGWSKSGSDWVYLDKNNNKETEEWRKGADDKWRYLNSYGVMATKEWVDNDNYYVDEQGLIVEGWKQLSDEGKSYWAYFQPGGKAVKVAWKKIGDKQYYFDENGKMLTGWILDNNYYTKEDGSMATGWMKLLPPDSEAPTGGPNSSSAAKWFYFQSTGRKFKPELANGMRYGEKRIDGAKYAFNENGELAIGWVQVSGDSNPTIKNFKYYNEDGTLRTGWYSLEPPEALAGKYEHLVEWFYFSTVGEPYAAKAAKLTEDDFVKINGKQYLFDQNGTPLYGIQKVYQGNNYYAYYLGTSSQCYIIKGKQNVKENSDTTEEYYFQNSNGRGLTGVRDSKLYYKGRLVKANASVKYQVFAIPNENGNGNTNYVVSSSGKIVHNSKVKDVDKVEYKTDASGVLTAIDGDTNIKGTFEIPVEPAWARE